MGYQMAEILLHLEPRDVLILTSSILVLEYLLPDLDEEERRLEKRRQRRMLRARRCWVWPWICVSRRLRFSHYSQLMEELRLEDPASFKTFLIVEPQMFNGTPVFGSHLNQH